MINNCLYLVITKDYRKDMDPIDIAKDAISGGVDIIQMREKNSNHQELLELGKKYSDLCKEKDVLFIVNDDPGLAVEIDADGVHIGQEDMKKVSLERVRRIVEDKIIGVSTHNLDQFRKANNQDVDYIAFGPLFETKTKDYHIGIDDVKTVLAEAKKPIIFIGGINLKNINKVLKLGGKNIALMRSLMQAQDIEETAKSLKKIMVDYNETDS